MSGSQRIKERDCGKVQGRRYYWTVFVTLFLHTYMMPVKEGDLAIPEKPSSILAGVELPREAGRRERDSGEEQRTHYLSLKGYAALGFALSSSRPFLAKWRHHILAQPRLSIYEGFLTNRQAGHAWVAAFIPHLACLHRTSTISTD